MIAFGRHAASFDWLKSILFGMNVTSLSLMVRGSKAHNTWWENDPGWQSQRIYRRFLSSATYSRRRSINHPFEKPPRGFVSLRKSLKYKVFALPCKMLEFGLHVRKTNEPEEDRSVYLIVIRQVMAMNTSWDPFSDFTESYGALFSLTSSAAGKRVTIFSRSE